MCMHDTHAHMCIYTYKYTHSHCIQLWLLYCSEDSMGKCSGLVNPQPQMQTLSQAAILLRERMRKVGTGITSYDCLKDTGELLVHLGSTSLLCSGDGKVC